MKRLTLLSRPVGRVSLALSLAFFFSFCSDKSGQDAFLSIKPDKADFGTLRANDPIAFHDVFLSAKNLRAERLRIESVELPDGFTYALIPGRVLEKDQKVTLKITMDIRKFSGPVMQTAYVNIREPVQASIPIRLEANVVTQPDGEPAAGAGEPDIKFDHKAAEFGVMRRDQALEHEFPFQNVGKKPLKVLSIKTMCSCLIGRPTRAEVPPGGSAAIVARMEAFNYEGKRVWKSLFVETNDPDEPIVSLSVSAKIIDPVSLEPQSVLFPNVRQGQPASAQVKMLHRDRQKLLIESIESSSPNISVDASPLEERGYLLTVTITPTMPVGTFEEVITLFTDDQSKPPSEIPQAMRPRLLLPVKGAVTGAISLTPRKINFGSASPGQTLRRKLLLSSRSSEFELLSVSCADPSFRAIYSPDKKGMTHEVTVEFLPAPPEREIESELVVTTGDARLVVPLFAAVKADS